MAISEEQRHHLYLRLEEVLGSQEATTLMEHLPPIGWADVATSRDIDALRIATSRDIDALRVATSHDLQTLQTETRAEFALVRSVLGAFRDEWKHDIAVLRSDFGAELHSEITRLVLWLVPLLLTALGLTYGVGRLA